MLDGLVRLISLTPCHGCHGVTKQPVISASLISLGEFQVLQHCVVVSFARKDANAALIVLHVAARFLNPAWLRSCVCFMLFFFFRSSNTTIVLLHLPSPYFVFAPEIA